MDYYRRNKFIDKSLVIRDMNFVMILKCNLYFMLLYFIYFILYLLTFGPIKK